MFVFSNEWNKHIGTTESTHIPTKLYNNEKGKKSANK